MQFTAEEIANHLKGTVEGNPDVVLKDFSSIDKGSEGTLSFLSNAAYESFLYTTESSAVLVNHDFVPSQKVNTTLIRVPNAYIALAELLQLRESIDFKPSGISELAVIDPSATIGENVYVGPLAYVGKDAILHDGVRVDAQAFIGSQVELGKGTIIYPQAVICARTIIGENCIIHSGAVVGADGFGFAPDEDGYHKIPQTGRVILEDNVEIGANACIDRAVMDATIIRKGVKIDNLVQIGHNCEIKEHTAIAAQSGIAGSTTVGPWNVLAGQVGIAGHLKTAKGVTFAAQTGVMSDIKEEDSVWFGYPAQPHGKAMRASAMFVKLPDMDKELFRLRKELEELKKQLDRLENNNGEKQ